jgi:predicted nucleotide-binding protein (sugar kinase/HSP70/actin superfamily)
VDDEALLGNDPVTNQWKGSDRCYAMAQYTGLNNGVEGVFCGRCGGDNSIESSAVQNSYRAVGQFSTSQYEE